MSGMTMNDAAQWTAKWSRLAAELRSEIAVTGPDIATAHGDAWGFAAHAFAPGGLANGDIAFSANQAQTMNRISLAVDLIDQLDRQITAIYELTKAASDAVAEAEAKRAEARRRLSL